MHHHPVVGRGLRTLAGAKDAVLKPARHLHDPLVPGVRREERLAGREVGFGLAGLRGGEAGSVLGLRRLHFLGGESRVALIERVLDGGREHRRIDVLHALTVEAEPDPVAKHVAQALEARLELDLVVGGRRLRTRGERRNERCDGEQAARAATGRRAEACSAVIHGDSSW